ncbi:MAG: acetyl-CoA carboxylase biotin carboxyl carrier protein [Phycisphaerae bacterium]|nr:acetyl-CoA carboxylase biotin carboxyl carrier protein [Phycisphaerae bacterium]
MADKKEDLKRVKELIDLMIKNDLVELEIVDGSSKIMLKRPQAGAPVVTQIPMPVAALPASPAARTEPEHAESEKLREITSPIVGTFYAAASPDSKPFVKPGSRVEEDTVVCIVEAMKVMNEIKAQLSGTIVEVLCKAGQAVEFGQALFRVRPD